MANEFGVFNVIDNTFSPDEVHRKSKEELRNTAFNDDQNTVLDELTSGGGGSAPLVVHQVPVGDDSYRLDKTWQEIYDAFPNACFEDVQDGLGGKSPILSVHCDVHGYFVIVDTGLSTPFLAVEPTDYPEILK